MPLSARGQVTATEERAAGGDDENAHRTVIQLNVLVFKAEAAAHGTAGACVGAPIKSATRCRTLSMTSVPEPRGVS